MVVLLCLPYFSFFELLLAILFFSFSLFIACETVQEKDGK